MAIIKENEVKNPGLPQWEVTAGEHKQYFRTVEELNDVLDTNIHSEMLNGEFLCKDGLILTIRQINRNCPQI